MEFVIAGDSETILRMVRGYFKSEQWPYREKSKVQGPGLLTGTAVRCIVDQPPNTLGCLIWLVLFVVTAGTALVVWIYWWLFERESILPTVIVTAHLEEASRSRVTVVSKKRPEYAEPVVEWIQRELVEGKKAARVVQGQPAVGDIPDQIRRLAELRDTGILTEEEFESKKRDLLDKM